MAFINIDFLGSLFSLGCTALLVRLNPLGWPLGLLANVVNSYLLFENQLYSNCLLEFYFFIATLYGWYFWITASQSSPSEAPVKYLSQRGWLFTLGAIATLTLTMNYALTLTDSPTPGLDSITTAISIVAQLLLARRYIDNWYLWFVTDAIYVYLYALKALPFHAGMMVCFLGLAIQGIRTWRAQSPSCKGSSDSVVVEAT